MNRNRLLSGLTVVLLLAGCADYQLASHGQDVNFVSFQHPFTDKAAADVLASAKRLCLKRGKVAIQTSNACSLEQCTTYYQCVDPAGVTKDGS
ncbi:MAG TPA: hypothetical protein VKP68_10010 [Ramlibacter sp.]|nr:hypothetical protein [Ramlibacter sp.]